MTSTAPTPPLLPDASMADALLPPDRRLALRADDGTEARCGLWWRAAPAYAGHRLGDVGAWQAPDRADDATTQRLLRHAEAELRARGCTLALGPMGGATWRPYRFVTARGEAPPFFLEPQHPVAYPAQFERAGYRPLAHYYSARADVRDLRADASAADTLARHGLRLRPFRPGALDAEAAALYPLTARCFAGNAFYTPMPAPAFRAQLGALAPHVVPDLALVAERDGEAAAYVLMIPDVLQAARGEALDTVVLKTLAVDPSLAGRGIGGALAAQAHARAARHGFRHVIHALMHEANPSARISARTGTPIRRYALFAKAL